LIKLLEPYFLDLEVYNTASVELRCDILAFKNTGEMYTDSFSITPALTTGAKNSIPMKRALPKGELISVNVSLVTPSIQRGQCFVASRILTSDNSNANKFLELFSGYITSNSPVGFPGTGLQSSLDGRGYITNFQSSGTGINGITFSIANLFFKCSNIVVNSVLATGASGRRPRIYYDIPLYFYGNVAVSSGLKAETMFVDKLGYQTTVLIVSGVYNCDVGGTDFILNSNLQLKVNNRNAVSGDNVTVTIYGEQFINV